MNELAVNYLESVKNSGNADKERKRLSEIESLDFSTQGEIKSFWCNVYNALVIDDINRSDPNLSNPLTRLKIYYTTKINVAGHSLSLQEIEHDILRRGKFSFTFGYLRKPLISSFKRSSRPKSIDNRIHFLLNCGAKSCPLIRILKETNYNELAEKSCRSHLSRNVQFDESINTITVPRIFLWYLGDFGRKQGIKKFVSVYTDLNVTEDTSIRFDSYDWSTVKNPFK